VLVSSPTRRASNFTAERSTAKSASGMSAEFEKRRVRENIVSHLELSSSAYCYPRL